MREGRVGILVMLCLSACIAGCGSSPGGGSNDDPTTFKKIVADSGFSCGLRGDHAIYCWGGNGYGSLGDGTTVSHGRPERVGSDTDWIDVDTHTLAACGIKADHSMWCWGYGDFGQLGDGMQRDETTPTKVISDKPGVGWKALSLGDYSLCGIHDDGSLACWGRVGDGKHAAMPQPVGTSTDWIEVAAGTIKCGLRGTPAHLSCWGESRTGGLGLGTTTSQDLPAQIGTDTWKHVSVGYGNACAIRSDNTLWCWGNNSSPRDVLKYGNVPMQIGADADWQSISLSILGAIGLRSGGAAFAWGANDDGKLGATLGDNVVPTPLGGPISGWSQISSGNSHSCGIASGVAYCWGNFGGGEIGNGETLNVLSPIRIGSDQWTTIGGGPGQCGLRTDGALMCWGNDQARGIGFGNTAPVAAPTRLGSDTWTAIGTSSSTFSVSSSCAIRDGVPHCWGDNSLGQLGIGNTASPVLSPTPAAMPAGSRWTEIAISDHTCAIDGDGALVCWGANDLGQLGTGAMSQTPITAPGAPLAGTWLHVAVARSNVIEAALTCGIQADHTLWCWGTDQFSAHTTPTQVGSDADWATLSSGTTGSLTTCAVRTSGTLWCWGGWVGNGTLDGSATPVQVGSDSDWATVSAGSEICATKTGGALWCWGNSGDLGDGAPPVTTLGTLEVQPAVKPIRIGVDSDWRAVMSDGSGGGVSCAIKVDGSLWCWGANPDGRPRFTSTPIAVE